ncbi:hypothetical protein COS54_02595 [Candidatus Shapirobacteria bacterium CG03_land_8_20_14_0_80_39_12]|uniref:Uncharacterized protein n=1 Tax=Candidatus Shapirobacteria bacterium CG03_land_8_20_14_0_80_39_12 TaxID=1974879 RepID=A0A2M7BC20_9BACT|nr:MAG: hypothetical protein COS54_02595 [Candidatus Shapirobacteria bacterium CG03_land_8_20_14_0_80_39_12]
MSKRRLGNLLKRKFTLLGKALYQTVQGKVFNLKSVKEVTSTDWMRNQFRDISRLGQNLVVMRIGK